MPIKPWWTQLAGIMACLIASCAWGHGDASQFSVATQEVNEPHELSLPGNMKDDQSILSFAEAKSGNQQAVLHTYGQVVPDAKAVLDINAFVSGQVRRVFVRAGDRVRKGQPVVSIFNPEFIATQKGHLQLLKNNEKIGGAAGRRAITRLPQRCTRKLALVGHDRCTDQSLGR